MINKTDLFVSPVLTNVSLAYRPGKLINEEIMPVVTVKKDTGKIATYGMDNLRIVEAIRAQGSNSNEVNHTVSIGDHYILEDRVLRELVAVEEMENADAPIKPKIDSVENLKDRMGVIREKLLADVMGSTAALTLNDTLSGTDQWNVYANSEPISDIQTGIDAVFDATGKEPNTLVFCRDTFNTLIHHPDIISRAQGAVVVTAEVAMQVIKNVFTDIDKVIVGKAKYNSGVEGGADSLTSIWTKNAWVMYIEPKPGLKSRSFGFTYRKKAGMVVQDIPMNTDSNLMDREGDMIRVKDKYDQKLLDVNCAYLIKDAIA